MRSHLTLTLILLMLVAPLRPAAAQPWLEEPVEIVALSNRADLISGGDVLVEVVLPDRAEPAEVVVEVGGREVTDAFAVRDDGRLYGRVEGMPVGTNRLTVTLPDGSGAYLDVTNHSIGGPIIAGPQVQPWICTTEDNGLGPPQDEQCNAPTAYQFFYMPEDGDAFAPFDPDSPPDDVAQTTTDEGVTVPYIVRRERGVIDRGIYDIAVLFDPAQPWEPWSPRVGWNDKLLYRFGGDCNPNHRQPAAGGGTTGVDVLFDHALARGIAVATSGLNVLGRNCNDVVSAESVVMVKEHFIEHYGEVRYTMGDGGSGGSMQQHWIVSNYPGVLDGILVTASYPDIWQTLLEAQDCVLLDGALLPGGIVDPADMAAVTGHRTIEVCSAPSMWPFLARTWQDATFAYACQGANSNAPASAVPAPWAYHPVTNPTGTRCTLQDYQVAQFGQRPPEFWTGPEQAAEGFANRPFDNTGVEYGREALEVGAILPEQFVALNENVGGYDIDGNPQRERNVADPAALVAAYRGGRVTYPRAAATVPIVDVRAYNPCDNDSIRIHTCFHTYAMRARLEQANGHADNQVILYQPPGHLGWPESSTDPDRAPGAGAAGGAGGAFYAFDLLDDWMAAIEANQSNDPLEVKVVRSKPAEAVHACWTTGERNTDWEQCQELNPTFGNPRTAAGGPLAGNVLKCRLKPLDRGDYSMEFSDAQWARLQAAFPDGVCDYSRPGVAQEPSIPWLTYQAEDGSAIPGGEPLGEAPVSVPFGPERAPLVVTRHGGQTRIETAVAVSGLGVGSAETVVIARADEYADALAGGPLAVHLDAPLLLSRPDRLTEATAAEIRRLGATQAVLLGGDAALGPQVAADLEAMGMTVRRIEGPNRFATAATIAEQLPATDEVLIARGDGFADALSASALGSATTTPILLVEPDRLPTETAGALSADVDATVVGGTTAVSQAIAAEIDNAAGTVQRLAGETRYATSAVVADEALARGITPAVTWVATGADFPDALVAGAAAGRDQGVLVLIDGTDLAGFPETRDWLATHTADIETIRIAGGTAAISDAVQQALEGSQ